MSSDGLIGRAKWPALGSTAIVQVTEPAALDQAEAVARAELEAIDRACSRFRADSELARVNARAGRSTGVGELLGQALEVALTAAELTDGAVDPTLGHALELAGYDRDWEELRTSSPVAGAVMVEGPTAGAGQTVVARLCRGWRTVAFDRSNCTVRVPAGIALDLGATAKAWAADRAAAAAARSAGCGALVSLGGDVATCGPAPASGWRVFVTDDHRAELSDPGQIVSIRSGGLATSSTSVRRWSRGGEPMHHIIDPDTLFPVDTRWRTISVAAADCTQANIATTAAFVKSRETLGWLTRIGLPARVVDTDGAVRTLGGWPEEGHER